MLQRRTDLAIEAKGLWELGVGETSQLKGVVATDRVREGYPVTTVEILDSQGAAALGKPVGNYVTLTIEGLEHREKGAFCRSVHCLAGELKELLSGIDLKEVLVVGLGNPAITPDAIGPKVVSHTLVTRHLVEKMPQYFGHYTPVSALVTGVLGTTGVESGELVGALCGATKPSCILVVDALTSCSLHRLCTTIQLSDTGIVPGSGVGNPRAALNQETMGVPVIALGVPTVVDVATLTLDVLEEVGRSDLDPKALQGVDNALFVTPKDIDTQVADLAKVVGYGITLALQPHLTVEDLELLLA